MHAARTRKKGILSDSLFNSDTNKQQSVKLCEVLDCTNHLACVAVLVIVPRNNLNLICVIVNLGYHCLSSIKERAVSHTDNIGRNNGILIVTEGGGSSSLHSGIDAFLCYIRALDNSRKDCCGAGGNGNSLGGADKLAVELGDNKADSLSSTC